MRLDNFFEATHGGIEQEYKLHQLDTEKRETWNYFIRAYQAKLKVGISKFRQGQWIWRGDSGFRHDAVMITPGQRKSQNTANFYTQWMSFHPSWRAFPQRNQSFICSTNKHTAENFGYKSVYLMIPLDMTTRIGICGDDDLWDSWRATWFSDQVLSLGRCFRKIGFADTNWQRFKQETSNVSIAGTIKLYAKADGSKPETCHLKDVFETLGKGEAFNIDEPLYNYLERVYDPTKGGFKVLPYSEYTFGRFNSQEVWFSSPALALKEGSPFFDYITKEWKGVPLVGEDE